MKIICNNCFSSNHVSDHHICSNLPHNFNDILKNMNYQLFVDDTLNYEQKMYILNHHNSIEGHFIDMIKGQIDNLKVDNDIRQFYLNNIDKFSQDLGQVNSNSDINIHFDYPENDEDDDYVDYLIGDPDLNNYDNHDDLENMLLDEYEIEHDFNVHHETLVKDDDADDDYSCGSICHCFQCHLDSDFDD